jgi:4-amino-4-deoxy-L-arabinose transferase-like glycosyltransferase
MPLVSTRNALVLILVLGIVLYVMGIGATGLNGKDEFRYAEVAKEILTSGDWLVLHVNGQPYPDKPPLFFWTIALSYLLNGGEVSPFAARLPLALFTLGCLLVTFAIARRLFDNRIALLASLALMVSFRFYWGARWLRLDIPLCFFVYLALLFFVKTFLGNTETQNANTAVPRRSLLSPLLFWVAMALATLVKGPVGVVLPLGSVVTFLILTKNMRNIRLARPLLGVVIFAVIVLAWLIPALLRAPKSYNEDLLVTQNVARIISPWRHVRPPYYFAGKLFADFQPWILFAVAAIWFMFKRRRSLPEYSKLIFLFSWFLFPFVLLSIVPGKRGQYLLPAYPALAILVAWFVQRAVYEGLPAAKRFFLVPAVLLSGAFLAAGAEFRWLWSRSDVYIGPLLGSTSILSLSAGVVLFGLLLLFLALRRHWRGYLLALFIGIYLSFAVLSIGVFPAIYSNNSLIEIAREIQRRRTPQARIFCLQKTEPQYIYYGDYYLTIAKKVPNLYAALRATTEPDLAILDQKDFEALKDLLVAGGVPYEKVFEGTVEWERIIVIQRKKSHSESLETGGKPRPALAGGEEAEKITGGETQ